MAIKQNISSIAFPAISTGIYVYPKDEAANSALLEVLSQINKHATGGQSVRLVVFMLGDENFIEYQKVMQKIHVLPTQDPSKIDQIITQENNKAADRQKIANIKRQQELHEKQRK